MHSLKGNKVLISPIDEILIDKLRELDVDIIRCNPIEHLIEYEKNHADMQLLIIDDTAFISRDSIYLQPYLKDKYNVVVVYNLYKEYPGNVLLNALYISGKLICKEDSTAPQIIKYALDNDIKIVNTKQGYSRCSALPLNSGAIITSDPSIYKSATSIGLKTLLISSGNIYLDEKNYGFIGGASGVIGDTVLFFGDIKTHPDYKAIIDFIKCEGMECHSLCDGILRDIGGFVAI